MRTNTHPKAGKSWSARKRPTTSGIRKAQKQVVHLWVKDNGIGISIEDQAKIFQTILPFG